MFMTGSGQTTVHTNTRSCMKGKEGDGLNVAWRKARNKGSDEYTHYGMKEWHDADHWDLREQIHFGRVYGRRSAFGNLFVKDYVFFELVENKKGDGLKYTYKLRAWENTGAGGTKLIADGNKYCNMMGHEGGHMDYVWTWSWGKMHSTLSPLVKAYGMCSVLTRPSIPQRRKDHHQGPRVLLGPRDSHVDAAREHAPPRPAP